MRSKRGFVPIFLQTQRLATLQIVKSGVFGAGGG